MARPYTPGSGYNADVRNVSVGGTSVDRQVVVIGGSAGENDELTFPAHDAVDTGNPLKMGGYASMGVPTAVSGTGDRVNAWLSLQGEQASLTTAQIATLYSADATNGGRKTPSSVPVLGGIVAATGALVVAATPNLRTYVLWLCGSTDVATPNSVLVFHDGSVGGTTLFGAGSQQYQNISMAAPAGSFLCRTSVNSALWVTTFANGNVNLTVGVVLAP